MTNDQYPTDLLGDLIDRKHQCLMQLRELGRRQFELVCEGSMSGLLDVLSVKQGVIVKLQSVERALDPFRDEDPEARCWRSPETRRECAEQVERCQRLLAEILTQEKQSEQELVRRRDETARQLQGLHRAGHARGAYVTSAARELHQLDLSSES